MDEELVGFPEEADNTQFTALPVMKVERLRNLFRDFIDLESIAVMTGEEFDFTIESDSFMASIRVFLTNDHVTNEIKDSPELFFISGPAVMLDTDGDETDTYLQVGGQFDFSTGESGVQLGTLTIWRRKSDPPVALLDAS